MTKHDAAHNSSLTRVGRRAALRSVAPWAGILFLTGFFHLIRGAPLDGGIFLAAGAALTADAWGLLGAPVTSRRVAFRAAVPIGLFAGVVLVSAPRYGAVDAITVSALGMLLLPAIWPQTSAASLNVVDADLHEEAADDEPRVTALRRSGVLWASIGVVGCLWEVLAYFLGLPSAAAEYAHPPLSDLVGPLMDGTAGRLVCVTMWLAGGYALLRRGGRG